VAGTLGRTADYGRRWLDEAFRVAAAGRCCAVKLITAVIRPEKLEDVTRAVIEAGARGMTAAEVRGFGQQYGQVPEAYPADHRSLLLPKLRIDVVVGDQEVGVVVNAIANSVRTGAIGDGKIWVCPVAAALRVRTGERDCDAV
jgi:nitrogen regulatory protein PII